MELDLNYSRLMNTPNVAKGIDLTTAKWLNCNEGKVAKADKGSEVDFGSSAFTLAKEVKSAVGKEFKAEAPKPQVKTTGDKTALQWTVSLIETGRRVDTDTGRVFQKRLQKLADSSRD